MRLDTGGGKSAIIAHLHEAHAGASAVIAHRQELVFQLSIMLGRYGVRHSLIASTSVRRAISAAHIQEFGRTFVDPTSRHAVVSIDSLPKAKGIEAWLQQVTLWTCDEAHHVLVANKWGSGLSRFTNPQCRGLLPTATPGRADGKGLGRHADGIADTMVEGPPMRWLIQNGYLTDYRIICPTSDLMMLEEVGSTGDWSSKQLKEAAKRSHIVGDVVAQYLTWAPGKLGITFSTDVETAQQMTMAYRASGVRAETLTGETEDGYRRHILRQFAARQIQQIVAVDIISEGFDLPAVEVASLARPTASLPLYMQQFGRALRPLDGKTHAIIIDHTGNTVRHQGPPDKPRVWSLDRRDKATRRSQGIPLRVCITNDNGLMMTPEMRGCLQPYESVKSKCPHCGNPAPPPLGRASPDVVQGDLAELDPVVLAQLRGEIDEARMSLDDYRARSIERHVPAAGFLAGVNRHHERQEALATLAATMTEYVRVRLSQGYVDREIHRAFWMNFGVDVMSAQALSRADAVTLNERVVEWLNQSYSIS